jgi:thiamine biosynthesis lipoprotein
MTIANRVTWRALGTDVHVLVESGDLDAARTAVDAVLVEVDETYSRFRSDSELSAVNAQAGESVVVSPLLARALEAALRAARLTDGLVDPTIGRALRLAGYDDDFSLIVGRTEPLRIVVETVPGWRALRFEPHARRLRVPAGVELDFGSTGKALAADLAAEAASSAVGRQAGVLVSLGGDIAIAGRAPDGGWRVLAAEDSGTPADSAGEVIAVSSGAVATSSTTVRRWRRGEIELHHLIDPRSGLPAVSPWRTASVLAATCVDANTAATAAIILGDGAPDWLEEIGLAARLVSAEGAVVRVGPWPAPAARSVDVDTHGPA